MGRPKGSKDKQKRQVKKKWSYDHVKYLKENFYDMTLTELSKELDRPKSSISLVAREYGMRKLGEYSKYSFDSLEQFDSPGVYLLGHNTTGMLYVGSSDISIRKRIKSHLCGLKNNSHDNKSLQRDWNTDLFHFGVIKLCSGIETATLEHTYLTELDSRLLYNNVNGCVALKISDKIYNSLQNRINKTETCWVWTGKNQKGYGMVQIDHKRIAVHRIVYSYHNNGLVGGAIVRHQCHNKLCVNPAHLLIGTTHDNALDSVKDGLLIRSGRFTENDVLEMYELAKRGWTLKQIGDKFIIHPGSVSKILRCETQSYAHILKNKPVVINPNRSGIHNVPQHKAFGENKTLGQWVKDARCCIGIDKLKKRLSYGMNIEAAILKPKSKKRAPYKRRSQKHDWDVVATQFMVEHMHLYDYVAARELSVILGREINESTYGNVKRELIRQGKIKVVI